MEHPHKDQEHTCQNSGDYQTIHTVSCHNTSHDGSKCRRRTGDLYAASAQGGDHEACHNGSENTSLRTDS